MPLSIEYCVTCNYRPIAASLAMQVKAVTGLDAELHGSTEGGAFEVLLDGEPLFSKLRTNRFPDHDEIVRALKERGAA